MVGETDFDSFTLIPAQDAAFTSGVTTLGTFTALIGLNAQTFAVNGVGRYVRLQVNSNCGGANVNIGEVAYRYRAGPGGVGRARPGARWTRPGRTGAAAGANRARGGGEESLPTGRGEGPRRGE